jgi:transposase-like protein
MDAEQKKRARWIELYLTNDDAGLTCRHCGISRPRLRKWFRRYQAQGADGLSSQSSRPLNSPNRKIGIQQQEEILALRHDKTIGARRIQIERGRSKERWLSRTQNDHSADIGSDEGETAQAPPSLVKAEALEPTEPW